MSTESPDVVGPGEHLELPVETVLRNARPYPPRDDLVMNDLTDDEELGFWSAITT